MSAIKEFRKLLEEAQKQQKESLGEATVGQPNPDMSIPAKAAEYLSKSRSKDYIPSSPENIEAQRWNDPLAKQAIGDFVTRKEMNESYGLFLQRIQQQMSTIGGGGEVNLRGLDDVLTSTTGTNKFLTYNPSTRKFYFDFINPATESELGGVIPGAGFTVGVDGTLSLNAGPMFELDESEVFQLKAGTTDRIGGIKAGPGVAIDPDGTLFIDSEGLPFTFGDFTGLVGTYTSNTEYALLSSINEDEDIVIASNGSGTVCVVGAFEIHATNGTVTGSLETEPFFKIKEDGQVRILVPLADTQEGGMEIIGSDLGTSLLPGIAGTMLHLTGNANLPTRVYHDTLGEYSSYVFRRYNGSVITPTQVLDGEAVGRINFTAATDAGMGNVSFAQIRVNAIEDQTTTAQGSEILLFVTPEGDIASNRVAALEVRASGVTSDVGFIGDLTGTASSVENALTAGTYLTSVGTYDGSVARTFDVDATTAATASKVVARDANGTIAATNTVYPTRNAGSFGAGQTLTINFATDRFVRATITGETVTVAYTNITPGKEIYIFFTNSSGGDLEVNSGVANQNATNAKAVENTKNGGTSQIRVTSFGTTVNDLYVHFKK